MKKPARPLEFLKEIIPNADKEQLQSLLEYVKRDKDSYTVSDYNTILLLFTRRLFELTPFL
jgi:hypothetical protein